RWEIRSRNCTKRVLGSGTCSKKRYASRHGKSAMRQKPIRRMMIELQCVHFRVCERLHGRTAGICAPKRFERSRTGRHRALAPAECRIMLSKDVEIEVEQECLAQ